MEATDTDRKMSSGEALAEILATVQRIETKIDGFAELGDVLVEQVQEVAAGGLGSLLGGMMGSNGNSEHSQDQG